MDDIGGRPQSRFRRGLKRYIYAWGDGRADGDGSMRDLLGGKGAGLAEMTYAGLPVPAGFTITTEACNDFFANREELPDGLWENVVAAIAALEQSTGKSFGSTENPLLVSVRSGAKVSMPGMMDTVLNLGLNDATRDGLAALTGNERFAWDAHRRFVQMFGRIVMDVPGERFEHALAAKKARFGVEHDADLPEAALRELVAEFHELVRITAGRPFPVAPFEQLELAIRAVFRSWFGQRARDYRKFHKIPDDLGTAVNVVTMVFGNMGADSGTGVAFTRDPNTGENELFGEYLTNAQGEDVVAGIRTAPKIAQLQSEMPEVYAELEANRPQARAPLSRRAGPRVHDRARSVIHAADALGEAHGRRSGEDRRRHGRGRIDQQGRSAPSRRTGACRAAHARSVRRERARRRAAARERIECVAGGRGRSCRVRCRRSGDVEQARRARDSRPRRDVSGRFSRDGGGRRNSDCTRRCDVPCGSSRAANRQALRCGLRRPRCRSAREDGTLGRPPRHRS